MRRPTGVAFFVALVPFAYLIARFNFLCDDSYIGFRFSKYFAEGLGLRYNLGVEPPVEGYTQFGWILLGGLIEWLGLDITVWSRVTTIACAVAMLFVLVRLVAERLELGLLPAVAAGLFLGTLPPAAVWATGGLETMAFALAIFLTFERLMGDPRHVRPGQALLFAVLATLLRADGLYWLGILLALALVWGLAGRRELIRGSLTLGGAIALVTVLHIAWRYQYYGDWLPSTARAKVGMSATTLYRGWLYLANYWLSFPGTVLVFTAGILVALLKNRPTVWVALAFSAGTFLYGILVGGDFMCMGRFFLPAAPFLAILLAYLVHDLAVSRSARLASLVALALLAPTLPSAFDRFVVPTSLRERTHFRWSSRRFVGEYAQWSGMKARAEAWAILGKALAVHTEPGQTLVLDAIGAVGYYSDLFIYDQYGLVNRKVARNPPPRGRRSTPGHDRRVKPAFFAEDNPTYMGAFLMPLGGKGREELYRGSPEIIPLSAEDGLPEDKQLVLLWNRRP